MTGTLTRTTAFALGFGFALLPAFGPFLAILFFISTRLRTRKSDLVWLSAALLYSLPLVVKGDLAAASSSLLQFGAGWLIFRAFAEIATLDLRILQRGAVGAGLLAGLVAVLAVNLLKVEAWNFDTAKTIAQAIVWESSPALFGHSMLVLGGLIAIVAPNRLIRWAALALAAMGILVSGSREAAIGWLVIAVVIGVASASRSWWKRALELGVVAVMVTAATGLGPLLGWGKVGFLLQPASSVPGAGSNLLQGTELPFGDWWDNSWVAVEDGTAHVGAGTLTSYRVHKNGPEGWLRLQQAVVIEAATTYTASAWIRTIDPESRPGIQGWGQLARDDDVATFVISGALVNDVWRASVNGAGALLNAGIAESDRDWKRVFITFEYAGAEPLAWFVGLTPDSRTIADSEAEFAGFQLERGELSPYQPGTATRGLSLAEARLPLWQTAWRGVNKRPFLGWGTDAFPKYFLQNWPERNRLHLVPAHPHNMFLHTWFERGVIGVLGIFIFLFAVAGRAFRRADVPFLAVLAAVVLANQFDTTLFYGGVFYPLVAVAGWRAGQVSPKPHDATDQVRQFVSRVGLAVGDTLAVVLAFLLATQIATIIAPITGSAGSDVDLPVAALYSLLLWPLLSWREGLYPGYGLTPQQELKKQTTVGIQAGLAVIAVLVFSPTVVLVPSSVLALTILLTLVTLPMFRASAKRALHSMGVWGRRVLILGSGDTGRRIARSLLRSPLAGLHPVAFFDDNPSLHKTRIHGVEVFGSLEDANHFALRNRVEHAIVAIPSMDSLKLRDLIDTKGRRFRTVQYVPNMAGLPSEAVFASSLDGMLALEVGNNLASKRNRFFKRTIDVASAALGLLVISPLLICLWLWVRLDSRGPAFYRSKRVGQNGDIFKCLKFRTMLVDAEARLEELIAMHTAIREEYERFHKLDDDPRVTRAGKFLRKYSLDELPQLFNVLMGQMSLVGPRPYLTRELPLVTDHSEIILQAKPGMTGYWQVSERNDVTFQDRLEMEAHYVRNWSIWWDIVILVHTLPAMLEKRGK